MFVKMIRTLKNLKILGKVTGCQNYSTKSSISQKALHDLKNTVGESNFTTAKSILSHHGQDMGPHGGQPPHAVVWPRSPQEVADICRICHSNEIPIIPFGTGTGLEGGIVALQGGVAINVTKMDAIVSIHEEDFTAVVQPGVTREMLNSELKSSGLWFPVDPGADASICGMCATGASGTNAVKYGTMKENCINMEVVLAQGEIIETAGVGVRPRKSSAGYNLTELFLGSEGTLGIITSATIRLHAIPECVASAVVSFPDLQAAVDTVVGTLQSGIGIARLELLDDIQMKACNQYSDLNYTESPTLFIEFHGSNSGVTEQIEVVKMLSEQNNGGEFLWSEKQEDRNKLWKARHAVHHANKAYCPGYRGLATDVCVPISELPKIVMETKNDIEKRGLIGPIVGHAGDGNFHSMLMFDPNNKEEERICEEVAERMARRALELGGTISGEHGVGIGKVKLLEEQFGPQGIDVMRRIKSCLDPKSILNPGKVIHSEH